MKTSKPINETVSSFDLAALRLQVATAETAGKESKRAYAVALNSTLPALWYTLRHDGVSDEARQVRKERDALQAVLKEKGHSNPSQVWAKVREYAKQEAEGLPTEAEKRGKVEKRDPITRNRDELFKLYKANAHLEEQPREIQKLQPILAQVLESLFKVDLKQADQKTH